MNRALNFNAGPAMLPEEVLLEANKNWLNFNGTGMAVMELSHRSNEYEEVQEKAQVLLRELLSIPSSYEVLFLQGGASLQFSMVPMNLLTKESTGNYILTGAWSEKAWEEAKKIGQTFISASSKEQEYKSIPNIINEISEDAAYLHITSNNTIYGTQWHHFPSNEKVPLVADMSSDILSRPISMENFDLIYAGAQKNLGPSGVTVVIIKKELLARSNNSLLPTMLNYNTYAKHNSLYNTPPTLSIYLLKLVLEWAIRQGGLDALENKNEEKANILYDAIDSSSHFYAGHADKESRSKMNVTFNLDNQELANRFLHQAKEEGFIGLNGHRSIGGCRASIYNAMPLEYVHRLAEFMKKFRNLS